MSALTGLSSNEAEKRLQEMGKNALPEEPSHPLLQFLKKFWAPVPWMLEIIIILEITLHKNAEAGIISILLLFNAGLSFFQEGRAKNALRLLRKRLQIQARVLRDGQWRQIPAQNLVDEDLILLRGGDLIPADVQIVQGQIQVDQSTLTGESLPVTIQKDHSAYASSLVQHGEAFAKVIATGNRTFYGKTAEIVRVAEAPSHTQKIIFQIVKTLVIFDIIFISAILIVCIQRHLPLSDILPFSLLLLVAAVPVALPATYTLASAIGAIELSKSGILVTHLTAIEEAAAIDTLCVDKTGTITQNRLSVSHAISFAPFSKDDLFALAKLASEEATQDPIDLAILEMPHQKSAYDSAIKTDFIPFDPEKKYSAAHIQTHQTMLVEKGAPAALFRQEHIQDVQKLSSDGSRVLAIRLDGQAVGLIGLQDQPRDDSKQAIADLQSLGIHPVMITGDDLSTAQTIAKNVGIQEIEANVFPQDKFRIVKELQKQGHICCMTGDGVNDAPALKQAEVGVAVSNATDVAKASASLVLTRPGFSDLIKAVQISRMVNQRMLTYTLNKIIKTMEITLLLGIGLLITHQFIISPLLLVLLLFANDFVTMSISTDHVSFSEKPDRWAIKKITSISALFAFCILGFSFTILWMGLQAQLPIEQIQTLIFLTLVLTGQANVYLVRERRSFWRSMPSLWMLASTGIDLIIISILAIQGILMEPIHYTWVIFLFLFVSAYYLILDFMKVKLWSLAASRGEQIQH